MKRRIKNEQNRYYKEKKQEGHRLVARTENF